MLSHRVSTLLGAAVLVGAAAGAQENPAASLWRGQMEGARRALGAAAHERLAELASRSPNRPLEISFTEAADRTVRPRVQFVAGESLAGPRCGSAANFKPDERQSSDWYTEVVRCFFRDNHSIYLRNGGALDFTFLVARQAGKGSESGEVVVELQQQHAGVDVKQGDLKAFFIGGELVSVSGSPLDPSQFPKPALASEESLLASGKALTGSALKRRDLYFDADRRRFILLAEDDGDSAGRRREHLIDAETGELIESRAAGHAAGETVKNFWTRNYPDGIWWWPGGWGSWSRRPAPAYCSDGGAGGSTGNCTTGAGVCRFFPHRAPGKGDFVTAASTVQRDAFGQSARTRVFNDTLCGNSPFDSWSWPDYNFAVSSSSYYLNELADIKNHNFSFFNGYAHTKYPIHLLLADFNLGGAGVYYPGSHELAFEQSRWPNNNLPNGAELLYVIAHEYGHYIHETYGMRGAQDLVEGWADQNMYRYAVHKKFVSGEWPLMDYFQWGLRHNQSFVNEEAVLQSYPTPGEPNHIFPGVNCSPNTWDPYGCGALIGEIYWELSFDRCRMGFATCAENQDIVQSGGYHYWAWAMTNSAYAYAISMATSGTDTRAFMNLVASRYAQFQSQYNFLSTSDLDRVYSAMAHHCLGPRQACTTTLHRLPGSGMPSAQTHKRLFFEGEGGAPSGGTTKILGRLNSASKDYSLEFQSGAQALYRVTIPAAGNYKVRFVARPTSALDDQIAIQAPGSGWKLSPVCAPAGGAWAWCDGPVIALQQGAQDIRLGTFYGGTYELDAFILIRQ